MKTSCESSGNSFRIRCQLFLKKITEFRFVVYSTNDATKNSFLIQTIDTLLDRIIVRNISKIRIDKNRSLWSI